MQTIKELYFSKPYTATTMWLGTIAVIAAILFVVVSALS
jgi:hypothetical protein